MCGIFGVISNKPVCKDVVNALHALEHRGIQSSGIISYDSSREKFSSPIRSTGSSTEVFQNIDLDKIPDNVAIGHNRYATSGDDLHRDAQPLYIQKPGLAMGFNGQIANFMGMKKILKRERAYSFFTDTDVEPLLFCLAQNLIELDCYNAEDTASFVKQKLFPALEKTMSQESKFHAIGAYSAVAIIADHGLLAFKDPHGIRPLCFAKKAENGSSQYAFSSETTALNFLGGFHDIRELEPGEAVFIDFSFNIYRKKILPLKEKFCPFEIVYFSQVDSTFKEQQVYDARCNLGDALAECFVHLKERVDSVIPVPKSPIPAATAMANAWKKPFGGIVARPTFSKIRAFQHGPKKRTDYIDSKFLFVESHIKGKRVALVDDSIVRGDTSKNVIKKLFELGAKEVHFFSTYPPYIGICPGGIDIADGEELLLHSGDKEHIETARKAIGATTLNFLPLNKMLEAIGMDEEHACLGCTKKDYPFDMDDYKRFQELRKEQRTGQKTITSLQSSAP
ncbi:MAG: amidophosphoribosyltransferase [Candidatus Woesearchaeota archaeon]